MPEQLSSRNQPRSITLSPRALKELNGLDETTRPRIRAQLDKIAHNPLDPRIAEMLAGQPSKLRRSRVGSFRIIFELLDEPQKIIYVLSIDDRKQVYRRL